MTKSLFITATLALLLLTNTSDAAATIETNIDITPNNINTKRKSKWISCKIEAPQGYTVDDIIGDTIKHIKLAGEVPAAYVQINTGQQIVTVKFNRQSVIKALVEQEGVDLKGGFSIFVDVTVTAELTDGKTLQGTETIKFTHNTK